MLVDWKPTDPEYKQALYGNNIAEAQFTNLFGQKLLAFKDKLLSLGSDLWSQPALAAMCASTSDNATSCRNRGYYWCSSAQLCYSSSSCCSSSVGCNTVGPNKATCASRGGIWCLTINGQEECVNRAGCCKSGGGCDKTCPNSNYTLDKATCKCICNITSCPPGQHRGSGCWCEDDPKPQGCTNKPSSIPCGQSWDETNCKLTGTAKTCGDGYSLDSSCNCVCTRSCSSGYHLTSSCTCEKDQVDCWDGSKADSESECPSYVTCWDGSKAYNWDGCPACPSGKHFNSSHQCVNDCPTDLLPCDSCSYETGVTHYANRTCSDETYEWSEEQCKCIISPRTLPRKGANFCKLFEQHSNIKGGSAVCVGSVIANNTTDFSNKEPDITLRNGLRIYNIHTDAGAISALSNNTQGGVYDGVPNTNSYGYTVYVDIDGAKGDSLLWSDVYPFYITLSGKVIPAYDIAANPNGSGGDSTTHLSVSVENEYFDTNQRHIRWLAKSVPFKRGACLSGYVGDATPYCRNGGAVSRSANCQDNGNSVCYLKQIRPVKFFF